MTPISTRTSTGKMLPVLIIAVIVTLFIYVRSRTEEQKPIISESKAASEVINTSRPPETRELQPILQPEKKHSDRESPPVEYQLDEIDIITKVKFVISIRLNKKATDQQLLAIAEAVKSEVSPIANRGAIFFLLPEMVNDNGAWASVDYLPLPRVRIIGQTLEDEHIILESVNNITDYMGMWVDNSINAPVIYRLRIDENRKLVFELLDASDIKPSVLPTYMKSYQTKKGKVFVDPDDPFDKYLLLKNGDLEIHDNHGLVVTYKKLRLKKEIWDL